MIYDEEADDYFEQTCLEKPTNIFDDQGDMRLRRFFRRLHRGYINENAILLSSTARSLAHATCR